MFLDIYTQPEILDPDLTEILDKNYEPFMVMPYAQAVAHRLCHKKIVVIIQNVNGKIYLHKNLNSSTEQHSFLTFSTHNYPLVGEASLDAVFRSLNSNFILTKNFKLNFGFSLLPDANNQALVLCYISTPVSSLIYKKNHAEVTHILVDQDELSALATEMPELLNKQLYFIAKNYNIFDFNC